jgi:PadR family transcriptional regulator AphA
MWVAVGRHRDPQSPSTLAAVRGYEDIVLLPGEWAVLGVLSHGRSHGFAIARELEPAAEVGQVWAVTRSRVYRVVDDLVRVGYARPVGVASGDRGPTRTLLEATEEGQSALAGWLEEPVDHVRDLRAELLLKLVLIHRRRDSPRRLLKAQRATLAEMTASIERRAVAAGGFDSVVAAYRLEAVRGALRFVEGQLAASAD